jgi:hypothetical protein
VNSPHSTPAAIIKVCFVDGADRITVPLANGQIGRRLRKCTASFAGKDYNLKMHLRKRYVVRTIVRDV